MTTYPMTAASQNKGFKCPACNYVGRTKRSVSTHWSHKHAGPCPLTQTKKICKSCGVDFFVSNAMLRHRPINYCSRDCWAKDVSGKEVLKCWQCGQDFLVYDSYAANNRKYCSRACQHKSLIGRIVSRQKVVCEECGDTFEEIPYRIERGRRFCSPACANKNKNFGLTPIQEKYRDLENFNGWRDAVFLRDGYRCVACGVRGNTLQAHHIVPVSKIISEIAEMGIEVHEHHLFGDVNNGLTMCRDCHMGEHYD